MVTAILKKLQHGIQRRNQVATNWVRNVMDVVKNVVMTESKKDETQIESSVDDVTDTEFKAEIKTQTMLQM